VVLEDPPLFLRDGLGENSLLAAFQLMRQTVPMLQENGIPLEAVVETITASPSATGAPFGTSSTRTRSRRHRQRGTTWQIVPDDGSAAVQKSIYGT
jgi:hypothetical protein